MRFLKFAFVFTGLFILLSAFISQPDADSFFESGKKHHEKSEYIKAISDYTMAISLRPDFGNAYLQRAKAKLSFSEKMGFLNNEFCFDLIQALNLGLQEAALLLKGNCDGDCFTLQKAVHEPEIVFCADLSSKILTSLPKESLTLINLVKLNLFNNKFTETPDQLSNFKSLIELDLSSNKLQTINPSIEKLLFLEELNLNKNELTALPVEIGRLKHLLKLYIRSNQLKELPAEIALCTDLESLDLSMNKLNTLPVEIYQLKKLKTLNLVGNLFDKKSQKSIRSKLPMTMLYF
ncbi:MAG: leucine-rich repeat domain-containing protein [Opitutaceae bacterium]|nr:leucine-rich repeat domain-containing protein [Cytophagales bacterium]